jgi:hypothetical protein
MSMNVIDKCIILNLTHFNLKNAFEFKRSFYIDILRFHSPYVVRDGNGADQDRIMGDPNPPRPINM